MKNLLVLLLLWPFLVFGQTEKSGSSIRPVASAARAGATFAVVVGISDYQNISDLQYADKDAEAFAEFLRSRAGGSLDQQHLVLLTNKNATGGKVAAALDDLLELVKKGDRVIFYFSGHGDVEIKTIFQSGYLLCWDSPTKAYKGNGGTYTLSDLQSFTNTLSSKIQAKVIIILDSCHAGKLSGNLIGGAHLTAEYEDRQFSNEVKILACSSKEFSLEGPQWGGGRGCFSYHLIEGLYGLADKNGDAFVSVSEIDRYLEDHVIPEAAPYSQNPSVYAGERTDYLSTVDPAILKQLMQYKRGELPQFAPAEGRVFEEAFLAGLLPIGLEMKVDSGVWGIYHKFSLALKEKRFLEPVDDCAERYFQQLNIIEALTPLHGFIKRNYAAALQDEAQQAINALMNSQVEEVTQAENELFQKYQNFPSLLDRSASLLGPKHYRYKSLKARQLLFEGALKYFDNPTSKDTTYCKWILEKYRQSLQYEQDSPIAHFFMSRLFAISFKEPDAAYRHAFEAVRLAETWPLPYAYVAFVFSKSYGRFTEAKDLLDKAMSMDSSNVFTWKSLGAWYFYQNQNEAAVQAYRTAIHLNASNPVAWIDLGIALLKNRQNKDAEEALLESIRLDNEQYIGYYYLGLLYEMTKRTSESEKMYLQAINFNTNLTEAHDRLAILYSKQNRFLEAEVQFKAVVQINPTNSDTWYNLTCLAAKDGRTVLAFDYLRTALLAGFKDFAYLKEDPDLESIRSLPEFKVIMKNYFPDLWKD